MTDTDTLREALENMESLVSACEAEYTSEHTEAPHGDDAPEDGPWGFPDDEAVSSGADGDGAITFGHIRRARQALATLSKPEPAAVGEHEALIAAGFSDYEATCALRTDASGVFCHAYLYSDKQWYFQTGGNDLVSNDGSTIRCVLTRRLYASPVPSGGADERKRIVAWLRSASEVARQHHEDVCHHEDDEILDTIVTRMQTYAYAADFVEHGNHIEAVPGFHRRAPSPSEAISPPDARAVVEVTPADRDRANEWRLAFTADGDNFGQQALQELAEDFARHRIAALQSTGASNG